MMQLTEELTSTENKVAFARQACNDAVTRYNTDRETFPSNMIAGAFNFQEARLFEIEEPAKHPRFRSVERESVTSDTARGLTVRLSYR